MADFNKPVGRYLWGQMKKTLIDLDTFVQASGVMALTNEIVHNNVQNSVWAKKIHSARTECLRRTPSFLLIADITAYLCTVEEKVKTWNPGKAIKNGTYPDGYRNEKFELIYPHKQRVQNATNECVDLLAKCRDYYRATIEYIDIYGTVDYLNCALVKYLEQRNIKPLAALTICTDLGAVLPLHLAYVGADEIRDLTRITEPDKQTLKLVVMQYIDPKQYTPPPKPVDARARLDCMRACLETV